MEDSEIKKLVNTGIDAVRNYIDLHPGDTKTFEEILIEALQDVSKQDIAELILTDTNVDPSMRNNIIIIMATHFGHEKIVEFLLKDPRVNPSDRNNQAIILASEFGHESIADLLLNDPRVDPSARNNRAIFSASYYNHKNIFKLLLYDPRVDPSIRNNIIITMESLRGNIYNVKRLLRYPKVNPGALDNQAIINATQAVGAYKLVELLLKDPRVDPGAQNNKALINASNYLHRGVIELLLKDLRVDYRDVKLSSDVIRKRKELDLYFGLITENDYYRDKPVELLKMVLKLFKKDENPQLSSDKINYIFMCLNETQFNEVINSDISDEDLSTILSCVRKIRFNIPTLPDRGAGSVRQRDLSIILKNLINYDFLCNMIIDDIYLLPLMIKINIGNENLLKVYRKYTFNLPLEREYQLGDIIGRRDTERLYQYILNGGYLPYVKSSKIRLELTPEERQFVESFMFPEHYHDDYVKNLDTKHAEYIHAYIYGKGELDGYTLCRKLRDDEPLTPLEMEYYQDLNVNIVQAPVTNKRCVLYRGASIPDFKVDQNTSLGPDTKGSAPRHTVWKAFSSCSSIKEISDRYRREAPCCLFVIIVPIGAVLLDITSVKKSEIELLLPPYSILKFLGVTRTNDALVCHVLKYLGYETDEGPFFFESEEERNKTLEEEMARYVN